MTNDPDAPKDDVPPDDAAETEAVPPPEGPTQIIDTEYEIGQDNAEGRLAGVPFDVHNPVFVISAGLVVIFVATTVLFLSSVGPFFNALRDAITVNFDWFFLVAGDIFVLICLGLIVSPYGRVRLGGPDATPDFSYMSWFAMLFAAGMGIGLVFYGVSEPISHYGSSLGGIASEAGARTDWAPLGAAAGDTEAARRLGMAATIYHWGLHPWAIYAIVALALALFSFNKGLPLTMRSIFYPVFGDRVWGWTGHVIDILAVLATLFGLATSLGFGAQQAAAGLHFLFDAPDDDITMVVLIAAITAVALISVLRGLDGGVKVLSEINMGIAVLLLLFVLIVGPTTALITGLFKNLVAYGENFIELSMPFGREDDNFRQGWTSFYWAWWISWSPFVGMFIARVSRGRTVREFITCVLIIPALVSVLWMTVFGGTAITLVEQGASAISDAALELKLFNMLGELPLTSITSFVGIVLVIVFFVTSSDSGSLVIDTITAGGKVDAPVGQRVFWAVFEGLVAIVLLLGGGLAALQAMAVSTGLPFTLVLLLACWAIIKGLRDEPRR